MATDFTKYVPLKQIVSYVLDENDKSVGDFDKLWVLAFRGLVEMNYEVSAQPQTVRLPIAANKTVALPTGLLFWTKIGVLNSSGELCTLKINNALTKWKDNNPNRIAHLTADVNDSLPALAASPVFLNYYNDGTYSTYYGIRGGLIQYGECTVDEANNVIVLNPLFPYTSIIVEGVFSPEKDSDYTVPIAVQEALISFIMWKLKLKSRAEFYADLKVARRRMPGKKTSMQEIAAVLRESNGMTMKS